MKQKIDNSTLRAMVVEAINTGKEAPALTRLMEVFTPVQARFTPLEHFFEGMSERDRIKNIYCYYDYPSYCPFLKGEARKKEFVSMLVEPQHSDQVQYSIMRDKWEYLTVIRAEIAVRKLLKTVCYENVSEILDSLFIPEIAGAAREWMINLVETDKGLSLNDQKKIWVNRWADERAKVKLKAKKAIPDHYSLELDNSELETLMSKLQEGCFISLNTVLDDFVYYLTGRGRDEPREPIIWTENKRALAFFVGNKFADTDGGNLWAIAEKVFVYKQKGGDRPKARSLAVDYSTMLAQGSYRYGGNSKVIKKLEAILKN